MPNNVSNSTNYEHPNEPNLVNLHKALEYNDAGQPCLRVINGETKTYTGDKQTIQIDSENVISVINGVFTTDTATVTNTMLAGSIANDKLLNSSVTINGNSVALGGSITVDGGSTLSADSTTIDIASDTISVTNLPNTEIGPIQSLRFDPTHDDSGTEPVGTMCWDAADQTMHIYHPNGVRQQVGQEQFAYVLNNTGATIASGTVVRFDGAQSPNGEARLEVAALLADGTQPSIYTLGVTTEDIADSADGRVTVFGKVRDIDTTGTAVTETWAVGDILYASPTNTGNFTKVKPTAPNNVTPIAAVLLVSATEGELFVRPTLEQKKSYGRFARTADFVFADADTAYALDYDSTEITNGATLQADAASIVVDQSGFYQVDLNLQADAGGGGFSSATLYTWLRINGVNLDNSTRRQGILGSAPSAIFCFNLAVSLDAGDEIEIMVAASDTGLVLDAAAATAFAPATASALISVTQIQL